MKTLSRYLFFLSVSGASVVGMEGEAFVKRFDQVSHATKTLSDTMLKFVGEALSLDNYSGKDIVVLGQSITVSVEETVAKRRRDEEPYVMPHSLSAGDCTITVCDGAKDLRIEYADSMDMLWAFKRPAIILALSASGNKLCVGCGKYGVVEELVFFGISAYRCVFAAALYDIQYPFAPYSLQWGNDEQSIVLYGRSGAEYRKLATKIPDAIFFLKNYECFKETH